MRFVSYADIAVKIVFIIVIIMMNRQNELLLKETQTREKRPAQLCNHVQTDRQTDKRK